MIFRKEIAPATSWVELLTNFARTYLKETVTPEEFAKEAGKVLAGVPETAVGTAIQMIMTSVNPVAIQAGFMDFFCEEAMQLASWGAMGLAMNERWTELRDYIPKWEGMIVAAETIHAAAGAFNPVLKRSYDLNLEGQRLMLDSYKAQVLSHGVTLAVSEWLIAWQRIDNWKADELEKLKYWYIWEKYAISDWYYAAKTSIGEWKKEKLLEIDKSYRTEKAGISADYKAKLITKEEREVKFDEAWLKRREQRDETYKTAKNKSKSLYIEVRLKRFELLKSNDNYKGAIMDFHREISDLVRYTKRFDVGEVENVIKWGVVPELVPIPLPEYEIPPEEELPEIKPPEELGLERSGFMLTQFMVETAITEYWKNDKAPTIEKLKEAIPGSVSLIKKITGRLWTDIPSEDLEAILESVKAWIDDVADKTTWDVYEANISEFMEDNSPINIGRGLVTHKPLYYFFRVRGLNKGQKIKWRVFRIRADLENLESEQTWEVPETVEDQIAWIQLNLNLKGYWRVEADIDDVRAITRTLKVL